MINRSIILIIRLYAAIVAVWMIMKPIFIAINHSVYSHTGLADWFRVVKAGFAMDCSMTAYLTVFP
ncbi:MAG: hypothetical protein K2G74_08665 [Muribaculaceae bacterium]|nr:hypothetical protein [Muribaculaceae bacterium]